MWCRPSRSAGFAAACCLVARLRNPRRPVLAVVDEAPVAVLAAGRRARRGGPGRGVVARRRVALDPTAHWARLTDLVGGRVGGVVTLATDPGQLAAMVDAAGPIVAWGGLAPNP